MVHRKKLEQILDGELSGKKLRNFLIIFIIVMAGLIVLFYLITEFPQMMEPFMMPLAIIYMLGGFFIGMIILLFYPWAGYRD